MGQVNHPDHYNRGKIEVIDYIEDQGLGFHLGNVVKYLSRAGHKPGTSDLEDLRKARWYLNRKIEQLEEADEPADEDEETELPPAHHLMAAKAIEAKADEGWYRNEDFARQVARAFRSRTSRPVEADEIDDRTLEEADDG